MANEARVLELYGWPPGEPRQYNVAAGTSLSKGTILALSTDPQTVVASSGAPFTLTTQPAGILAMDKDGADGSTKVSAYTNGLFDLTSVSAGNLAQVGQVIQLSGANLVRQMALTGVSGAEFVSGAAHMLGIAQETASANEVIAVRVRL